MTKRTIQTVGAVLVWMMAVAALPLAAELQPEAGFISLEESVSYVHPGSYFNRIPFRTSPARIWYVFQPADEDAASKPLFVFFNGGPGGATSTGLLCASTGRLAIVRDELTGGSAVVANPASWTRAGNLLHVDSRTTGFSYSLMDDPGDDARRRSEFDSQNYNPFVDGADFVRFLLKFLADHPSIRGNRVVLVPESYGGIRTIVMLHLLLYYGRYADGTAIYQDPALVAAIKAHYGAVFPQYAGATVPPAVIAGQFGHQVLIQTALTWSYQRRVAARMLEEPKSPLYQVAAETGIPYIPYKDSPDAVTNPTPGQVINYIYAWLESVGRDAYHMAKPAAYFSQHRAASEAFLTRIDGLNTMSGVEVTKIPAMYASARRQAYKTKAAGFGGTGAGNAAGRSSVTESRIAPRAETGGARGMLAGQERLPAGPPGRDPRTGYSRRTGGRFDFSALVGPPPSPQELAAWFAPADENDLMAVFGIIQPWDRYFINTNYDVPLAFANNRALLLGYEIHYNISALYGKMFLENAAWVETFATNAAWDSVVYSAALPEALALHADILSGAQLDVGGPPQTARPGQIVLAYRPSTVAGFSGASRTVRFPSYVRSGHAVTLTESLEILQDVMAWLEATGLSLSGR